MPKGQRVDRAVVLLGLGMMTAHTGAAIGSFWAINRNAQIVFTAPVFPVLFAMAAAAWGLATFRTSPLVAAAAAVLTAAPAFARFADLMWSWVTNPAQFTRPGSLMLGMAWQWMVIFLSLFVASALVERAHRNGVLRDDPSIRTRSK